MLRLILPPLLSIAVTALAAVKTIKWLDPRKPASAGNTPLHLAARELPAEAGAEIETRTVKGWSPLDYAASHSGPTMAELLLAYGADINARDDDGWTALHKATFRDGEAAMVDLLLDAGADPALRARMSKRSSRLVTASEVARDTNPNLRGMRALERLVARAKAAGRFRPARRSASSPEPRSATGSATGKSCRSTGCRGSGRTAAASA